MKTPEPTDTVVHKVTSQDSTRWQRTTNNMHQISEHGAAITPHGIVLIDRYVGAFNSLTLEVVHNTKRHVRWWNGNGMSRNIATHLAKQFAQEIVEKA